jgi:hypothetical protein
MTSESVHPKVNFGHSKSASSFVTPNDISRATSERS